MVPTAPRAGTAALESVSHKSPIREFQRVPWHSCERSLIQEARSVVSVKQSVGIEHASCQISQIDSSEAIGSSCVASHAENAWVSSVADR
jgi:hypothetical protein